MFGLGRDNRSLSERVLVPAAEPANDDSGVDDLNEGPSGMSYTDILDFVRRRKCMVACVSTGVLVLTAIIITTICSTASSSAPIPPTPTPTTTPTSTTTSPTTTPTSTTTSPTTTPTSTTTSPTTTPTSTTTSPTTTPTSTTTSPTTTSPTTTKSTTTSPTTTSTQNPDPPVPTTHPIPPHPESLPPKTLLLQVGLDLNFTQVQCTNVQPPPTFRSILEIKGISKNYTGESNTKKHSETAAAMQAAIDLLGVSYNYTMPVPKHPCFNNETTIKNSPLIISDNV